MKKRTIAIIVMCLIVSMVLFLVSSGYKESKDRKLEDLKYSSDILKNRISANKEENNNNAILIDKIEHDPNILASDAKKEAVKFVDVIKESKGKSDSDKSNDFKKKLKGISTEYVYNSKVLSSIVLPKKYDIDVSTERGGSIEVLISSDDRYLILQYDSYSELIDSVKEYKKTE
ncbi:hypothetical protein ACF0HT_13500 (plasmid) [Staphylococcus xylosus]|uniref:hypothetical protein n=1 Tax=Staphylococcus xylosus TaxID=1288 RepID=UPI002DB8A043|nr:hypothetical protein [Staphylococcus xylosus]MEB8122958.1 hypothetical protein [Staphylococcus xylosus]